MIKIIILLKKIITTRHRIPSEGRFQGQTQIKSNSALTETILIKTVSFSTEKLLLRQINNWKFNSCVFRCNIKEPTQNASNYKIKK